jgi:thiol:disulfide interchange protein DsbD
VWLGLQLTHTPDWHTYWKNSGDSGLPTELEWTLPPGVSAGAIEWPTPRKFPLGPLANYGYSGTVLLPVPLTIDPTFKGEAIEIKLYAAWLACRKECIPEEGHFSLRLPVQGPTAINGMAFEAARAAAHSAVTPQDQQLGVQLAGLPAAWRGQALEFFPETPGLIEPGAPWTQSWDGERWTASVPLSPHRSENPAQLPLVVALANPPGEGPGSPGVRLDVPVQGVWPATAPVPAAVPDALTAALQANAERVAGQNTDGSAPLSGGTPITLWAALIGALIGGVILNLMPCVFPVLAIKLLALAQHGGRPRAQRLAGLAYTAGVVLSFLALGGLLLALRAAGEQLGWGFQLQSPLVVALLAALFTVIGLNLAGVFEFGQFVPGRLATLQARHPVTDALLSGVVAVAIASPCTAPFMGASLGFAVAMPTPQALAVFGALGLGMALPYLLAGWVPAVAHALPRPGPWMHTFRRAMAFPMLATVVWLVWVLGQQSGIDGAGALLALLVVGSSLVWALTLTGRTRIVLAGVAAAASAALLLALGPHVVRPLPGGSSTVAATDRWQPWSPERAAELTAAGRPVFVDFTAAWCVTCQYNKRTTLADAEVLGDFATRNVALLRADWTRRDPAITAALAQLGRSGVPVYVLHAPGKPPVVLSEILGKGELRAALAGL